MPDFADRVTGLVALWRGLLQWYSETFQGIELIPPVVFCAAILLFWWWLLRE